MQQKPDESCFRRDSESIGGRSNCKVEKKYPLKKSEESKKDRRYVNSNRNVKEKFNVKKERQVTSLCHIVL